MKRILTVAAFLAFLVVPRCARADDDLFPTIARLLATTLTVPGELIFATIDSVSAAQHRPIGVDIASVETGFAAISLGIDSVPIVILPNDVTVLTWTITAASMSTALFAHGVWALRDDPYGVSPWPFVIPVAALDASVLAFDALFFSGPPRRFDGALEVIGGLSQVAFGAAQAAGGRPEDVAPTFALLAVPSAMVLHGFYELFRCREGSKCSESNALQWMLLPMTGSDSPARYKGLVMVGTF